MIERLIRLAVCGCLLLAVALPGGAVAADEPAAAAGSDADTIQFSEAERVLWMTDQLGMITEPVKLKYAFKKTGTYEDGFTDSVELEILKVKDDGMKSAKVNFFTGERHHFVPENDSTNVNPVLGIFLQGDVYEMNRLTEGHWRYFHRRLKYAFAEAAEVATVDIEFDGKKVKGKQVRIMPYAEDEHRSDMKELADKRYYLTVSDDIPGYLYEIHTVVPGKLGEDGAAPAEPLIDERLVLVEVKPLKSK